MQTFSINTLGCKVNKYESQQIRQLLEGFGLCQARSVEQQPDLVVINTCCVTHTASAKSRQLARKAEKLNPDAVIVVAGCLPAAQIGELPELGQNTLLLEHRNTIASALKRIVNKHTAKTANQSDCRTNCDNSLELPLLNSFKGQTRAFLKIQDGCDGCCSYCIIPKTRPIVKNKPFDTVLSEAAALVQAGHKEIVLTGVFLGAYGRKTVLRKKLDKHDGNTFAELLEKLAQIPDLARIRLSSLEPADITQRLLDMFCKNRNIMPHLHLSIQSGSNAVLKNMRRQYRTDGFREKIDMIKSQLDRPAITADFIVGFPGESEADFQQTLDLAKDIGLAKMHIFPFSPRKGTDAADMPGMLDRGIINERCQVLKNLGTKLAREYRQLFVGDTSTILLEKVADRVCGRSERYFMVFLEKSGAICKKNQLVRVKLIKNSEKGMVGKVL